MNWLVWYKCTAYQNFGYVGNNPDASTSNLVVVVGSTVGAAVIAVLVILMVLLILLYCKYRSRKQRRELQLKKYELSPES